MKSSRKRKAVSTILGVLVFIGIMFSAVVPMQLTMQQADIHAQKILNEVDVKDDEYNREHLTVYAYPTGAGSDQINVRIINDGRIALKAIHI